MRKLAGKAFRGLSRSTILGSMVSAERERLEDEIRRDHARGDHAAAARAAVRGFGPEIYAFLCSFLRQEADADEVFSIFCERLWTGLPRFAWECSFRTWAYTIARNAARNYAASARVRVRALMPDDSGLADIAATVRSETASYLRSQIRDGIARLRESLSEEERMLLTLRVDRDLSWSDLARVLRSDTEQALTAEEERREAARLRKRFQTVKEKLARLARAEGLLGPDR